MEWQPTATIATLKRRAKIIANIRSFFTQRNYLEVETPIMAQHGVSDIYLSNIKASFRSREYCLQTSPEYHMKRLLAAGSGPIFQLIKAFRDDELGRWHNPEFTMLEWYQLDADHHQLMAEMDQFLQQNLHAAPLIKKSYQQIFIEICGIDPWRTTVQQYQNLTEYYHLDNILSKNEADPDQYLFLLMTHVIEPAIKECEAPIAIYDFPLSQAALARTRGEYAERFEIYYQGIELANGFHELQDAKKQQQRFNQDSKMRQRKNLAAVTADPFFLSALQHGLPACSGVALGVDRLIALALGKDNIAEVIAFDIQHA